LLIIFFLYCTRGGGGGGRSWQKSGSGLNKHNSISDFVSCGNYLVNEGYIRRDHLGAVGWSAGCLLVGATINMFPQLFRAAVLKVFVILTLKDGLSEMALVVKKDFEHLIAISSSKPFCQVLGENSFDALLSKFEIINCHSLLCMVSRKA